MKLKITGHHYMLSAALTAGMPSAFREALARQVDEALKIEHLRMLDPDGFARAKALAQTTTMSFWQAYHSQELNYVNAVCLHTAPAERP